ncbi:MAG: hypothetical protein GY838_12090 [bacterium]|nr:hypothetical protein [bacterium]
MRRMIQVTATLVCGVLFVLSAGCGGSDDPADPGDPSCSIEFTSPASGVSFNTGDTVNLRWNASGGGDVRLSLVKAGAEQSEIAAATPNDGYYSWTASTLGAASGTDFGLALTHTTNDCADTLALSLVNTAGCTFTVDTPDTTYEGDDVVLTWTSMNTTGTVDVELWYFTVDDYRITQLAIDTPDDGEFLWENVDSFHEGTSDFFAIRVYDAEVDGCFGASDPFRIVDDNVCEFSFHEPLSSSVYDEGGQMRIRFSGHNDTGNVDFFLYEGYVNLVAYIANDVPTFDGEYMWTIDVPDGYTGLPTTFRVKAVDSNDEHCTEFSHMFTINLAK